MTTTPQTADKPAKKSPTEVTTVAMTDGRLVDFAGKRRLLKSPIFTPEGRVQVRFDFRNGETRLFTIPEQLLAQFAAHGAEQKIGDEIAGLDKIEDAILAIDELIDRLYNGEWGIKRETGSMAGTSVLLKALVEVYGKPVETIREFLKGKTQAEKLALRANERIRPVVERLEREALSKRDAVDTDALLQQLEG